MRKHRQIFTSIFMAGALLSICFPAPIAQAQSIHDTEGPSSCGLGKNGCHSEQNAWWESDAHWNTLSAMAAHPNSARIADLSGVGEANMLKGDGGCMSCHGTVVSSRATGFVDDGVSCESCHGPGSAYLGPHSEGDVNAGTSRVGYAEGLRLGMLELKKLDVRAQLCVSCHFVNDPKLIRAGHPDGRRFSYAFKIKTVANHWRRSPDDADLDSGPFQAAFKLKDTIQPPAAPVIRQSAPSNPVPSRVIVETVYVDLGGPLEQKEIVLDRFPDISDSLSIDSVMNIIKARLDHLYKQYQGDQ